MGHRNLFSGPGASPPVIRLPSVESVPATRQQRISQGACPCGAGGEEDRRPTDKHTLCGEKPSAMEKDKAG